MKKVIYLLLFISVFALQSCQEDIESVTVTYNRATAVYGDLSEIRSMPLLTEAQAIQNPGKVFVATDWLLIGEEEKGIHIVDNTNIDNPIPVAFINIPGNREFYVEGNIIYAESLYDMLKIDISDVRNPSLVSRVEQAFSEEILNDEGEVLIGFTFEEVTEKLDDNSPVSNDDFGWNNTFYFDYANNLIPPSVVPASFAGAGSSIGSVNRIAVNDNSVYVISRSNITVFEDTGDLRHISTNPNNFGWNMETIFAYDNHLFIGTPTAMMIFSADQSNPRFISSHIHETNCTPIDPVLPVDDVAYVALRAGEFSDCPDDVNTLSVLDISNINNPREIQEIEMESPYGISLINNKLYVGEGEHGLKIFDATNKRDIQLEQFDESIQAFDVIQHPTLSNILLIAGPKGIGQYRIENTDKLSLVSWLSL